MEQIIPLRRHSWRWLYADCVERRFYAEGRALELGVEEQFLVPTPDEEMSTEELQRIQQELAAFEQVLARAGGKRRSHRTLVPRQTSPVFALCASMILVTSHMRSSTHAPHRRMPGHTQVHTAPSVVPAIPHATPDPQQRETAAPVPETTTHCLSSGPNLRPGECCVHASDRADVDAAHFRPDPAYKGRGRYVCEDRIHTRNRDGSYNVSSCNWCEPIAPQEPSTPL